MKITDLLYCKVPRAFPVEFVDVYKDAQVFLIDKHFVSNLRTENLLDDTSVLFDEALPFKRCYFEIADKEAYLIGIGSGVTNELEFGIGCLLVDEVAPGNFRCAAWVMNDIKPHSAKIWAGTVKVGEVPSQPEIRAISALLQRLCTTINECNLGIEYVHKTVNIPPPRKCAHKLESIIRLSPKINKVYPKPLLSSAIDWTVAWRVRGHWRKLDGVGKNRDGIYNVNGFTWISEHLRGNTDGPIKKHIYELEQACHVR